MNTEAREAFTRSQIWYLERYASLTSQSTCPDVASKEWEYFDNTNQKLELTLTSTDHILIHHGRKQLESVSLLDASSWMKGLSKGDSLMVIFRIKNQSRRFRVKFSSGDNETADVKCRDCVDQLAKYFPIKLPTAANGTDMAPVGVTPMDTSTQLMGDVTLSEIAKAITKSGTSQLPSLYSGISAKPGTDLNTLIKLCLTDVSFPAYVEQVEQELDKIKKEYQ